MHQINPAKLLNSKWTAVTPQNKEKHFIISKMKFTDEGVVELCQIEAVLSKRQADMDWRDLKDPEQWRQGWK